MNELISVNFSNENPTVLGRELHAALEISSNYTTWFSRVCEYGFTEGIDYTTCFPNLESENQHGGQNKTDHAMSIPMAKEICMIQRSELGGKYRKYFLELENSWNTPEAVMARALQFANNRLDAIKQQNIQLTDTLAVKEQQISELQPKASYYDVVLNCKDLLSATEISKDYGKSAKWLNSYLHDKKIQFKQGDIWLLYQKYAELGYTNTKTQAFNGSDGNVHTKVHTYWTQKGRLFIYQLLKTDNILPIMER